MAGIYIHIPFCASKCNYCDFYSVKNLVKKTELLSALKTELNIRKNYLQSTIVDTIYFGGGTPSLIETNEISDILARIGKDYKLSNNPEITIEANPDDLSPNYLKELLNIKINRLSIGVQSFGNKMLQFLNRRHNAVQSEKAIKDAQVAGFKNIGIDLIYGLPNMSLKNWGQTLQKAVELNVQHISAYHLTVEKNTSLYKLVKANKVLLVKEKESFLQFKKLIEITARYGFEHYEISNFAKPNFISRHNSNYWKQQKYVGIGPSAHSFDIDSRRWNGADIKQYISQINTKDSEYSFEKLDEQQKYNDYIITSLRTSWGIDVDYLKTSFNINFYNNCLDNANKFIKSKHLLNKNNKLVLTLEGMFISDTIISEMLSV